jgi:hypothetical protein
MGKRPSSNGWLLCVCVRAVEINTSISARRRYFYLVGKGGACGIKERRKVKRRAEEAGGELAE